MINILIFGPPGSGKGTQSKKIVEDFNFSHISVGELLRQQISNNTDLGNQVAEYTNNGLLVPDILLSELLNTVFHHTQKLTSNGIILDGFPRSISQIGMLNNLFANHSLDIDAVFFLEVPRIVSIDRIKERSKDCIRLDDINDDKIIKRMEIYDTETKPLYDYFLSLNKLYTINGVDCIDVVYKNISSILNTFARNA